MSTISELAETVYSSVVASLFMQNFQATMADLNISSIFLTAKKASVFCVVNISWYLANSFFLPFSVARRYLNRRLYTEYRSLPPASKNIKIKP